MVNLGQASAILYGTTAPSNTDVIWAKTSTADPQTWVIQDFLRYNGSSWISLTATHYSTTAPVDTTKIWLDTNASPPLIKTYNGSEWRELNKLRSTTLDVDFDLGINHNNTFVNVDSAIAVVVKINDIALTDFACKISQIGAGAVILIAGSGVNLNGVNGSLQIASRYGGVLVQKIDTNEYLVQGNLL